MLFAIGSILYISLIFNRNVWVDEAFSANIIRSSFPKMWEATVKDTLPPFYNVFSWCLVRILGSSTPVMKLSSVLPMIGLLFLARTLVYKYFGFLSSFFSLLLFISMPHFYYYGVEIRMYSFGMLSVTMAGLAAYSVIIRGRKRDWLSFSLCTAFCGYVHHFALISASFLWLFLLLMYICCMAPLQKKNQAHILLKLELKNWALGLMAFLLFYLPGLCLTAYQIKNASSYFSMSPLSFKSFFSDLRFPFVTHITILSLTLVLCFFAILALAGFSFLKAPSCDRHISIGLSFIFIYPCTLLFGYGVSLVIGRSLFTARYLVPSLSIFWLGTAILMGSVDVPFLRRKWLVLICTLVTILTGCFTYHSQFIEEYDSGVEEMLRWFDSHLTENDAYLIYEDNHQIEICLSYYYPKLKRCSEKELAEVEGNIWYLEVDGYEKELEKLKNSGYNAEYIGERSFDRYSFRLYLLKKL